MAVEIPEQTRQQLRAGSLAGLEAPSRPVTARQRAHLKTVTELDRDRAGWLGITLLEAAHEEPFLIRRGDVVEAQGRRGFLVGVHPLTCRPLLAEDSQQLLEMSDYFDQQHAESQRLSFRFVWWFMRLGGLSLKGLPLALLVTGFWVKIAENSEMSRGMTAPFVEESLLISGALGLVLAIVLFIFWVFGFILYRMFVLLEELVLQQLSVKHSG